MSVGPSTASENNAQTPMTSPSPAAPREPSHAEPLTPLLSPGVQTESKASLDTNGSRRSSRSHLEYLDSLQPPSKEEFARLVSVQEEREKEHKRHVRELRHQSIDLARKSLDACKEFMEEKRTHHLHMLLEHARPGSKDSASKVKDDEETANVNWKAATVIQRTFRGYRTRREMEGLNLDANTRWTHAIRDARWKKLTTPRARGDSLLSPNEDGVSSDGQRPSSSMSAARQNWKKATAIAIRAGGDEDSSRSGDESDSASDEEAVAKMTAEQRAAARERREHVKAKHRKHAKTMGLQYFLEMVDVKHRYGSNLRQYHEQWKKADTNENYFYWLDHGEGRNVELASCPRERLEREQVRYLSREERQHYLVKVNYEGRLVWAKNGLRIDTTDQWRDSINGIVPVNDDTPAFNPTGQPQTASQEPGRQRGVHNNSSSDFSIASESELEAARAAKYATPELEQGKGVKKVKHVSAATIFNKLLRKSVRKGTWIFVADTAFRLYVGIKDSGAFQHSSFLQGARILAAGLIKIKDGRLSSLSPLSGHYRPPAANFRAFVHSLQDDGVDMSHVSISKSYAVLVGLEAYVKTRKKGKEAVQKMTHRKEKLLAPELYEKKEEEARDKSESAAKERRFLEKEEQEREENRAGVKLLQKLGIRPRGPENEASTTEK